LTEPPIKLLTVSSYAVRFPAAKSKYRTSLQNGKDEAVDLQSIDVLNGFPSQKLMLQPGGCATYVLPLKQGQKYLFVEPARKKRGLYADYCGKGKVNVKARITKDLAFSCFTDPNDCLSKSCLGDLTKIVDLKAKSQQLHVEVCADPKSINEGRVWELKLSVSSDAQKINGVMQNEAALRLRHTQNVPDFNTQISITSLVGKRAVGKSTIASLLSGNETMFVVGSSTKGTTTTGADISTVIPTGEYAKVISKKLGKTTFSPKKTLPLFLVDSEGMNLRGDAFDFATTSPPAVVAKMIIWVGEGTLQTAGILHDIGKYLDGLDQIIMGGGKTSGTTCKDPKFGHFAIVLNKMLGSASDESLFAEIMTDEPDYIDGYDTRNQIRNKLRKCFAGLTVHGLPKMNTAPKYANLDARFKAGLSKIVDTILDSTLTPRTVAVGPMSLVMNSTNAETIMETVIAQANKGKIDLTGLDSFWTFKDTEVKIALDKASSDLKVTGPGCRSKKDAKKGNIQECSPCVCAFNRKLVDSTEADVNKVVAASKQEASTYFKADSTAQAKKVTDRIAAWKKASRCESESKVFTTASFKKEIFDMGVAGFNIGSSIKVDSAFFCNSVAVETSAPVISVVAKNVYVHDGAAIDFKAPAKACDGKDGKVLKRPDGANGCDGQKGRSFTLNVSGTILKGSAKTMRVVTRGGPGGKGGNAQAGAAGGPGAKGANGANGVNGKNGAAGADNTVVPTNGDVHDAAGACALGKLVRTVNGDTGHHCSCRAVQRYITQYYEYDKTSGSTGAKGGKGTDGTDAKPGQNGAKGGDGKNGGNGGNGGKGGDGGDIKITGAKGLTLKVEKVGGSGGLKGLHGNGGAPGQGGPGGNAGTPGKPGIGGPGGWGRCQSKKFTAEKYAIGGCHCSVWHCHCDSPGTPQPRNFKQVFGSPQKCNQGQKGDPGKPGKPANNGSAGPMGKAGQAGKDGAAGKPGASKNEDVHS